MATKPLPSQEVLRQLLDYDPDTGALVWRARSESDFEASGTRSAAHICALWNVRYSGTPALNCMSGGGARGGYREGHLAGQRVKAHRVIWKFMTGQEPEQIDHINGDRSDNRSINLRDVKPVDNAKNHKRRSDNTSGVVGVYWYPHERKHGKWLVKIRSEHLGYFQCLGQAIKARREAERRHGFHANHGRAA